MSVMNYCIVIIELLYYLEDIKRTVSFSYSLYKIILYSCILMFFFI